MELIKLGFSSFCTDGADEHASTTVLEKLLIVLEITGDCRFGEVGKGIRSGVGGIFRRELFCTLFEFTWQRSINSSSLYSVSATAV